MVDYARDPISQANLVIDAQRVWSGRIREISHLCFPSDRDR